MKKSEVNVSTTGIKGGTQSQYKTVGLVNVSIDEDRKSISVDGFDGVGSSYQQRETSKITFQKGDILIQFQSFDEVFDLLQKTLFKLK